MLREVMARLVRTFDAPYVAGYLAKKIFGNAPVVIAGIRSILAESVPLAYINGLQPSACAVIAGRCIPTGTLEFVPQLDIRLGPLKYLKPITT
jgi:hypothetical protein